MGRRDHEITRHAFNVLAGAATVHDGMFLLLKRSERESFLPDTWGIPAGQAGYDEDMKSAALRELAEETGLRGVVAGMIGYSTFHSERDSIQLANVQINFLVITPDYKVKLNPVSHSDHRWISLDDLENELLDDFTKSILSSARLSYKEY
jgi:8-oxo-dGTP pyrophosphatase MutT (NUDIX family)